MKTEKLLFTIPMEITYDETQPGARAYARGQAVIMAQEIKLNTTFFGSVDLGQISWKIKNKETQLQK